LSGSKIDDDGCSIDSSYSSIQVMRTSTVPSSSLSSSLLVTDLIKPEIFISVEIPSSTTTTTIATTTTTTNEKIKKNKQRRVSFSLYDHVSVNNDNDQSIDDGIRTIDDSYHDDNSSMNGSDKNYQDNDNKSNSYNDDEDDEDNDDGDDGLFMAVKKSRSSSDRRKKFHRSYRISEDLMEALYVNYKQVTVSLYMYIYITLYVCMYVYLLSTDVCMYVCMCMMYVLSCDDND
jgi:hypothetical protein